MINEEIVNKICESRGLRKMGICSVPTWIDVGRTEGIELRFTKVYSFWVVGSSRNYDEPASASIQETMNLIQEFNNGKPEEKEKGKEKDIASQSAVKTDSELAYDDSKVALLPEFLTPALVSKWAKMTTVDRMLLFQKTPKDQIFQKPVTKTESVSYVKGNYMIKEANAAFIFDWKFVHQGLSIGEKGVCVYGTLEANVDGKIYTRPAVGYEEINAKMTAQLAIKSATTDAIKKGLSLFGFNSDVYGGEV